MAEDAADNKLVGEASNNPPTNTSGMSRGVKDDQQHIILFYKYHVLSPDFGVTEIYRQALDVLCQSLHLTGRILVGCSRSEGINGTLAGTHENVRTFTHALLGQDGDSAAKDAVITQFRRTSKEFFEMIGEPELVFDSPDDFKWSISTKTQVELFPDLNVKLVSEIIGTGGVLSAIPLEETARGYLTPKEWHDKLSELKDVPDEDTVLIDCRNTKEYAIGHFQGATDPKTTTFAQFPKWVKDNQILLSDKKVYMYCTGGIRCEKASAYIRKTVPSVKTVNHLKGGIHKYLEEYGEGGLWRGRNFVFHGDSNASTTDATTVAAVTKDNVVGRCVNCDAPFDRFDPHCVCTVCREPTLVCLECQDRLAEYHCRSHSHLRLCYFSNLERFTPDELDAQLVGLFEVLDEIAVGRRFKQKRKTIQKQIDRVRARLDELNTSPTSPSTEKNSCTIHTKCRNCGDSNCSGRCWGFFGLKRKERLDEQAEMYGGKADSKRKTFTRQPHKQLQLSKQIRRDKIVQEIIQLNASLPPSAFRAKKTGIRVMPCSTRLLECRTKAKWCGQTVLSVVQSEFVELNRPEVLKEILANGLLRVNGRPVTASEVAELQLKGSDTIGRIIHWHEAPVQVPEHIGVEKYKLPASVLVEYNAGDDDDAMVYVCNKPPSVPVHPAGPYLANSLTMMVEAQENLPSHSLNPLHRTDRVTSGITLCTTSPAAARVFRKSLSEGSVDKLYLAKVAGKFPSSGDETSSVRTINDLGSYFWSDRGEFLVVDASVHTVDAGNGIRSVDPSGKPSRSLFRLLAYDDNSRTSIISCFPITGRNHQIRVHLQWMGFPIVSDVKYGGQLEVDHREDISESASVHLMVEASKNAREERRIESLSEKDVLAAKRACPCCRGAHEIINSFTPAQLLYEGHAIYLHAYWYRIRVLSKNKTRCGDEPSPPVAQMHFEVAPPEWVNQDVLKEVEWLNRYS